MNITQVKIFPVEEDKLKAFVSIVFDQCFMVNDIKVIQGKDGLFLSMPSRRKKSGEFKDVAHPLNNETRRMIEETVLSEYRAMVDDATPRRPDRDGDEALDPSVTSEPAASPRGDAGANGSGHGVPLPMAAVAADSARQAGMQARAVATHGDKTSSEADGETDEAGEPTLEEVQEMHLSDSFWTVS